jgi:hypothetical protein
LSIQQRADLAEYENAHLRAALDRIAARIRQALHAQQEQDDVYDQEQAQVWTENATLRELLNIAQENDQALQATQLSTTTAWSLGQLDGVMVDSRGNTIPCTANTGAAHAKSGAGSPVRPNLRRQTNASTDEGSRSVLWAEQTTANGMDDRHSSNQTRLRQCTPDQTVPDLS